jgi:hypothetical protein
VGSNIGIGCIFGSAAVRPPIRDLLKLDVVLGKQRFEAAKDSIEMLVEVQR